MEVRGIDGELKQLAEDCITIRPNFSYTLQEIQENAARVFSTNYFRSLSPRTKVTQDGVKLIFNVRPAPHHFRMLSKERVVSTSMEDHDSQNCEISHPESSLIVSTDILSTVFTTVTSSKPFQILTELIDGGCNNSSQAQR